VSGPDARGHVEPWPGATDVYLMGADDPTHAGDVTVSLPTGVASLRAHRAYLDGLGRDFDPRSSSARSPPAPALRSAYGMPSGSDASSCRACDPRTRTRAINRYMRSQTT
jgi:hypothetical protein